MSLKNKDLNNSGVLAIPIQEVETLREIAEKMVLLTCFAGQEDNLRVTDDDLEVLFHQDTEKLNAWWKQLNTWDWPSGLADPEPKAVFRGTRRLLMMQQIDSILASRATC